MRTQQFRDLLVWQRSMELARLVYRESTQFPRDEIFGLRHQLRRAAVSVPSNIAEGHGRLTDQAFGNFLGHARGSLYEMETQLQLAADLDLLPLQTAQKLISECNEVGRLLNGLLRTIRTTAPNSGKPR